MKAIKLIVGFLSVSVLAYIGVIFILANQEVVAIKFFGVQTPEMPVGFVILTSTLLGMMISGLLCLYEIITLYVQNRAMRRKLGGAQSDIDTADEFSEHDLLSSDRTTDAITDSTTDSLS
jgi:uncharacterized integral membrane protein